MSEEQIDPEKVNDRIQQILRGSGGAEDVVPLQLDPAVAKRLSDKQQLASGDIDAAADDPEEEDLDLDPNRGRESKNFESTTPDAAGIKAWSLQMPTLPQEQVQPTDTDKMMYMKAMLHDEPIEFSIKLPVGNLLMKIRSLNNYEQDVIFKALDMDQKDESVKGPAQYVTWLQYYAGIMQITEFNRERLDYVTFKPGDGFATTGEAAVVLREKTRKFVGANNWATWQVKLTGLRIFEEKLSLCNRAVIDANFWMPADTD
jgi:hypothetical protein